MSLSVLFPQLDGGRESHLSVLGIVSMVSAPFVVVGLLTPLSALMCLMVQILRFPYGPLPGLVACLTTCALGLMGGGAYSLDAIFYGRRKVILQTSPEDRGR